MLRMPEFRQLLIGMSTRRYFPPSGTAGLARSLVRGKSPVPAPPPMMIAKVSINGENHEEGLIEKDLHLARPCGTCHDSKPMCGIVGYIGKAEAVPVLLDGLRRLEYRGYDSAGVATVERQRPRDPQDRWAASRISPKSSPRSRPPARLGISHTRWATHGRVTDDNAHPHFDNTGKLVLVHNGVIENYQALRTQLRRKGTHFPLADRHRGARASGRRGIRRETGENPGRPR